MMRLANNHLKSYWKAHLHLKAQGGDPGSKKQKRHLTDFAAFSQATEPVHKKTSRCLTPLPSLLQTPAASPWWKRNLGPVQKGWEALNRQQSCWALIFFCYLLLGVTFRSAQLRPRQRV